MYTRRRGFSKKLRLIPIDATKNIVQFNFQIATASTASIAIAAAAKPGDVDEADIAKTYYVEANASIRGFALGMRIFNESGVQDSGSTVAIIRKAEGGSPPPTIPVDIPITGMNSLGTRKEKNRIFHLEQAITGSQVSGLPMAMPSIKIPKRFHVMRTGDWWILEVANNTGNNLRACGAFVYKWYR